MRLLNNRRSIVLLAIIAAYFFWGLAFGAEEGPDQGTEQIAVVLDGDEAADDHGGIVLTVLLQLIVILLVAKLGGDAFERFHQPAVLGELVVGMIIGNMALLGIDFFEPFKHAVVLEVLAELGVIILLFEVGLESSVREMTQVGLTSFMVAVFGVVTPLLLGWGVGILFLPDAPVYVHIFIGVTMTATSVGITARVLKDIGKIKTREAKVILGAAVIDDILGLVILAVVAGIISAAAAGGNGISSGMVLWIIAKAVLFIVGAIVIGNFLLPRFSAAAFRMKVAGVFLSFALLVCFLLAWIAGEIGLAPIVGAFAAGLILEDVHFQQFTEREAHGIEDLIAPISIFLVPIFFVRMGMLVDLSTFAQVEILGFAAVMTLAAIIGKQICSLAVFDKSINRLAIGLGMVPRGEVGLIVAGIGAELMLNGRPVITTSTYSAVVIMVILTTLITPPALKMVMLRGKKQSASKGE